MVDALPVYFPTMPNIEKRGPTMVIPAIAWSPSGSLFFKMKQTIGSLESGVHCAGVEAAKQPRHSAGTIRMSDIDPD
jgi:hypothetical protein